MPNPIENTTSNAALAPVAPIFPLVAKKGEKEIKEKVRAYLIEQANNNSSLSSKQKEDLIAYYSQDDFDIPATLLSDISAALGKEYAPKAGWYPDIKIAPEKIANNWQENTKHIEPNKLWTTEKGTSIKLSNYAEYVNAELKNAQKKNETYNDTPERKGPQTKPERRERPYCKL